jgi:ketosteroid isomerase-like protein
VPDRKATIRGLAVAFRNSDLDAIMDYLTADAEILPLRAQLENKSYVGREGIIEMFADLAEDWEDIDQRFDELRERDDWAFATGRLRTRSNATGIDLDVPLAWALRFEGDRVAYGKAYSDLAEAARAAGLED